MSHPYAVFLPSKETKPLLLTGIVTALAPLTVQTEEMTLSAGDFLVNAALLPREIPISAELEEGSLKTNCSVSSQEIEQDIEGSCAGTVRLSGGLTVGDRVALCSADGQRFILLCRVVAG